jgi:hypothetical protein
LIFRDDVSRFLPLFVEAVAESMNAAIKNFKKKICELFFRNILMIPLKFADKAG